MAVDETLVSGQNPAYGRPVCLTQYSWGMTIDVRPAKVSDARGIAGVHVRGWQEAYAHLVPAEALGSLSVDQRELRWREVLGTMDPTLWVAVEGDEIVGFARSGRPRESDSPRELELGEIYLLASHHGSGAGQRLMDAVIGDSPAVLWVADDNPRARAFYKRNGFVPDGVTKVGPLAGTDILEVRMVR
jgi:ribosomal protein S18 acetylase RimI-like enzyme